jgi:hypothetical protein
VYFIAETMGADPVKTWKDMVGATVNILAKSGKISDEERTAIEEGFKDDELQYHRDRDKRSSESKKRDAVVADLERRTSAVVSRFGKKPDGTPVLDERAMVEAYDAMLKAGKREEEITPEALGDFFLERQSVELAEKVVDSLADEPENRDKAVQLLAEAKVKYPEFTEDDLKQLAEEAFGGRPGKTAKVLSKKVRQAERKPPVKRDKTRETETLDWNDID